MALSVWFVSSQVELAKGRMVVRDKELQVQQSVYHGKLRKESLRQKKKKGDGFPSLNHLASSLLHAQKRLPTSVSQPYLLHQIP